MSAEPLYERYKEALKRGHVASVRGQLDEALSAYAEAATIAPERATPHTSAGTALMRQQRPADALRHYSRAVALAPRDDAALLGRAQALAALDQRSEAADAFDALAEVRAESGNLADAVDAARRALELAEGRERRRTLERLIARLRDSEPGEPGRAALDRALQVLDGVALGPARSGAAAADGDPATGAGDATDMSPAPAEPVREAIRAALDRDLPDDVDAGVLDATAARRIEEGAREEAVASLLDLATVSVRAGHVDAALDACYRGLSVEPGNIGLHLALVELYDVRGWSAPGRREARSARSPRRAL